MPPRKECGKLSPLITPDPHYIPGYLGHVPGFRFHFGDTFGHASNKLLVDPCIAGSGNLVKPLDFNVGRCDPALGPLVRSSGCNFPRLTTNMVPGYSGRIPAYDNVFGLSYARGTEQAIRDFECNQGPQRATRLLTNSLADMNACNGGEWTNTSCPTPLWSTQRQGFRAAGGGTYAGPYDRQAPFQFVESPYYMQNDDPRKFFMSGYTGFVPNTQSVIGNVYPITTNKGLRTFTDKQCQMRQNFCKPVVVATKNREYELPPNDDIYGCERTAGCTMNIPDIGTEFDPALMTGCGPHSLNQHDPNEDFKLNRAMVSPAIMNQVPALGSDRLRRKMQMFKRKDPHPVYRITEGLMPTYGGHVPNQQFRFGGTFGTETVNARSLAAIAMLRKC